jgi:hypothetical protein
LGWGEGVDAAEVDGAGGGAAAEGVPGGAGVEGDAVEAAEVGARAGVEDADARARRAAHGGVEREVDRAVAADGDEQRRVVRGGAGAELVRVGRDDAAQARLAVEDAPDAAAAAAARGGVEEDERVHVP